MHIYLIYLNAISNCNIKKEKKLKEFSTILISPATSHISNDAVCWAWDFHMQKADDIFWVEASNFIPYTSQSMYRTETILYQCKQKIDEREYVHGNCFHAAQMLMQKCQQHLHALWNIGGMVLIWENFSFFGLEQKI